MVKGLTAKEVAKRVVEGKMFILDVRNESDFQDWKIEGKGIESINRPYFDLIDGVEDVLEQLPKEEVLVVCAKEGSSVMVAEMLDEAGIKDVYYLEGGMKAWSEYLMPVKIGDLKDGGSIYQFNRIGKGCLSYLVESNGEAAIIDSARTIEAYEDFAKENNIEIKHMIDTHLHADHISGGRRLAEKTNATYWLPSKDAEEVTFSYEALEEGKDITIGNTKIEIQPLYTPGHTIGSTSMIVDGQYLLSGDILFVDSIGRPDLAGKAEDWVSDLRDSLYNKYNNLSKDLLVLPAHFGKISELDEKGAVQALLGELFEMNEGLKIESDDEFRRAVTENLPPQPNAYQEIRQTNMGKIDPTSDEQREMEIGPNRCAITE
ncbi:MULTISPECIES: MBL fold metallo-hydrolase [Metabacillus]|uniref:MBL fold metallo-hydrolase n=1 Tax=Metabacillus hrfriensis TaxID=3048891 RepID=A0ACD4RCJ2_9BACI|nr:MULTISPECIES: MBL fold metallo-hydrolase [Metabacillus]UAL52645.1 MBL fold metallo-hydrolase [Metabacillus dongyingensis]UOK58311.1 MBL fold metallo-hydrolase [Bacillus sp. OVS6]USK28959.1 MBL fold metallo-hydrolase [Bacillus sp. CMF21]WHZ58177.1 MBL fold metallo-hydrolase [Metabacillus sp. CT-WN-B3]